MLSDLAVAPLLVRLAWRNLWRQRRRTLMILFALSLAVWAMVVFAAIARGSMEQQLERSISQLTGHLQIHAMGFRDDPSIEQRMVPLTPALVSALARPDITAWAGRVRVPAVATSEREAAGITLVGVDPVAERHLSFGEGAIREGRFLASPEDSGIVIGRKLADRLDTGLGRRIVLMSQDVGGQVADRGFRIIGIFATQPRAAEENYVFVGRAVAQEMLGLGSAITEVGVVTTDRDRLEVPLARLRVAAPFLDVQTWAGAEPLLRLTRQITDVFLIVWYVIVFAAMSFGLVNTLLMAVFERAREFGLFQALGMPPRHIVGQVLAESLMLLLLAMVLGNMLVVVSLHLLGEGIDLSSVAEGMELVGVAPVIRPELKVGDVFAANALVIVLGLAASAWPAWRAARQSPVASMGRV